MKQTVSGKILEPLMVIQMVQIFRWRTATYRKIKLIFLTLYWNFVLVELIAVASQWFIKVLTSVSKYDNWHVLDT